MSKMKSLGMLMAILALSFIHCTKDPKTPPVIKEKIEAPTVPVNELIGEWELSGAERNGTLTNSLEGIYFNFTSINSLQTNFNPAVSDRTYTYQVNGNAIKTTGTDNQSFLIEALDSNQVVLTTTLRGADFKLMLAPKAEEEEAPEI